MSEVVTHVREKKKNSSNKQQAKQKRNTPLKIEWFLKFDLS